MKKGKQYEFKEAIKEFYKTEPLQKDLANEVANKIFMKQTKAVPVVDKWLYVLVTILVAGGVIYSFVVFTQYSLTLILLTLICTIFYFGLSIREYSLMSRRFLSLE